MVHVPKELADLVLESLALHFNKTGKTYLKTSVCSFKYSFIPQKFIEYLPVNKNNAKCKGYQIFLRIKHYKYAQIIHKRDIQETTYNNSWSLLTDGWKVF